MNTLARELLRPPYRTFLIPGSAYGLPQHIRLGVGGGGDDETRAWPGAFGRSARRVCVNNLTPMTKSEPLLRFSNVNTYYGPIHILQDVTLDIYSGELVCLLGGNASGKSTTLKTALGVVRPHSGTVTFDGEIVNDKSTSYRVGPRHRGGARRTGASSAT